MDDILISFPLKRGLKGALATIAFRGIPVVKPRIVRVLPHDTCAFTQGLTYHGGVLYESTGSYENSSLRAIDPRTGVMIRKIDVPGDFAEGIASLDDNLYQLSWKSEKARQYSLPDLSLTAEFHCPGEGWGLAAAKGQLVATDGSSRLKFLDSSFAVQRHLTIRGNGIGIRWLNDLEYARDSFYINVVGMLAIVKVNATTGRLEARLDCSELASYVGPLDECMILNGIGYSCADDTFYVTGKKWPALFQIRFP